MNYCKIEANKYLSRTEETIKKMSRSELLIMIDKLGLDLKFYCGSAYQSKESLVGWAVEAQRMFRLFFH